MNVRFYIDPETNLPHIYKHKVTEDEVEEVLSQPGEDRPGQEGLRVSIYRSNTSWSVSACCLCSRPRAQQCVCDNSI